MDELDYVDIPDIINTQYRNIVHILTWTRSIDLAEQISRIRNCTGLVDEAMKALFCADENWNYNQTLMS